MKLFNDDCLNVLHSQTFLNLTKGKKVVIVTDPPFNIGYHYNKYKDRMDEEEYYSWLEDIVGGVFSGNYSLSRVIIQACFSNRHISRKSGLMGLQLKHSETAQRHCFFRNQTGFYTGNTTI